MGVGATRRDAQLVLDDLSFRIISTTADRDPGAARFVLVHGVGTSHRYFARLHDDLARDSDTVSVDLPGFGGQARPVRTVEVGEMATALGHALDTLGTAPFVLVGHSMGAQWVVELAAQRPDLARAVVIIGPVTDRDHRSMVAQALALAWDTVGETMSVNRRVFVDYLRAGPSWFLRQVRRMVDFPIEDRIAEVTAPVLVVRGGNDPIAGTGWSRLLRDRASHGSMAVVPGHRHVVQHTAPRTIASAIRAFVAT
ncbi:alpha/beta fold hydrolase [Plantibacter sp. MMLR14_011]|uniref:alpha/beta fold hydrolase n=1 Tax=Plantibacter sp. MMLR14_011 TaxID=1898746 RepID=UPI0008DCB460|nr:alpha/beta hydrolase [Plantibacter sp. MMLR14_011]OII38641.1 hypothetical protein BIU99_08755 [Plantibacter sp. MMLR14_011]